MDNFTIALNPALRAACRAPFIPICGVCPQACHIVLSWSIHRILSRKWRFTLKEGSAIAESGRGVALLRTIVVAPGRRALAAREAAPVARAEHIWILHEANYKPSDDAGTHGFIGTTDLSHLLLTAAPNE